MFGSWVLTKKIVGHSSIIQQNVSCKLYGLKICMITMKKLSGSHKSFIHLFTQIHDFALCVAVDCSSDQTFLCDECEMGETGPCCYPNKTRSNCSHHCAQVPCSTLSSIIDIC